VVLWIRITAMMMINYDIAFPNLQWQYPYYCTHFLSVQNQEGGNPMFCGKWGRVIKGLVAYIVLFYGAFQIKHW
jgi:hypothetical protein